ncbi:MAG TPA: ATP-binding protein, partial [Verrucomicrobiae bacterium]|nr:ATP-binding protein [Verrucomicrobiae bacterium]
ELAQTIKLRQQGGLVAALPIVKGGHGRELMDEIRQVLEQMATVVEERFGNSMANATMMIRARTITAAVVSLLDILFLWWAYQRLSGEMERSEKATAEALHRKAELEDMVTELQHISYAITHDMRAPLRAMSTFAEFLIEDVKNAGQEAKDYCRRIIAAAARMDKLIQDALYYTKAVSQEIPTSPVDLSKLIPELIETYPNLQKEKADVVVEGELACVLGNEALLTQCFSNLLGNAVKFVAPGVRPNVRIWSEEREGMARIWIQDNGIGIPVSAQGRLFKMFERLTHNPEGSGIGLALVRKLVQRMGGKVGVESKAGQGSRFWVELRVADSGH